MPPRNDITQTLGLRPAALGVADQTPYDPNRRPPSYEELMRQREMSNPQGERQPPSNQFAEAGNMAFEATGLPSFRRAGQEVAQGNLDDAAWEAMWGSIGLTGLGTGLRGAPRVRPAPARQSFPDFGTPQPPRSMPRTHDAGRGGAGQVLEGEVLPPGRDLVSPPPPRREITPAMMKEGLRQGLPRIADRIDWEVGNIDAILSAPDIRTVNGRYELFDRATGATVARLPEGATFRDADQAVTAIMDRALAANAGAAPRQVTPPRAPAVGNEISRTIRR